MRHTFLTLAVTACFFITFSPAMAASSKSEQFSAHQGNVRIELIAFCTMSTDIGTQDRCRARKESLFMRGVLDWCENVQKEAEKKNEKPDFSACVWTWELPNYN